MKKILIFITLFLGIFWVTYAAENTSTASDTITVQVTEKMPWMDDCVPRHKRDWSTLYTCKVEPGFASVQKMLAWMIKYFTFIAGIGGVLFLVVNGIMYSMGGMDPGMKDKAKERIWKTLSGLVVLLLSWVILNLVAPWIYK